MFTTCIFCHGTLGTNEAIEQFPVGRRLAFDGERGRLWVVCTKCLQWNLTPLEERWEAIEECERLFRDTRLRVSTDHVGLARLPSGLELVRIGSPQRPEFAAWRYGDQFGRRRRANLIKAGVGLAALGGVVAGGVAVGIGISGFGYGLYQLASVIVNGSPRTVIARLEDQSVGTVTVRRKHLSRVQLLSEGESGWTLGVPHKKEIVRFTGERGVHAIGRLLPQLNRFGGSDGIVRDAVGLLEREGDPSRYFASAATAARGTYTGKREPKPEIALLPEPARLALEMAAHEESERRALEGELAVLELAWKEAEEIAGIADNMFLPASVDEFLRKHRR